MKKFQKGDKVIMLEDYNLRNSEGEIVIIEREINDKLYFLTNGCAIFHHWANKLSDVPSEKLVAYRLTGNIEHLNWKA